MLREVPNVRQIKGESKRRWFSDDYFDLIIWLDETDEIVGFQLGRDRGHKIISFLKFKHRLIDIFRILMAA